MKHARSIKLASPAESFTLGRDPRFSSKSLRSRVDTASVATGGASKRASDSEPVQIFTDGACKGNPGHGGWGAVLRHRNREKEIFGGESETTNNRMELTAVIEALQTLKRRCHVIVHTDSKYVQLGVTEWLPTWIRNGWKTAAKKPVKNADLWQRLAEVAVLHDIEWRWVRGHAGHAENERADQLANRGAQMVSASNQTA